MNLGLHECKLRVRHAHLYALIFHLIQSGSIFSIYTIHFVEKWDKDRDKYIMLPIHEIY